MSSARVPARLSILAVVIAMQAGNGSGYALAQGMRAPVKGERLAERMARALKGQTTIEVTGKTEGPGSMVTNYLMRYKSGGREYLSQTGGPWSSIQIRDHKVSGMQSIFIGRQVFTSMDGSHWYRGKRLNSPTAIDALSLNLANVPCCLPVPGEAYVRVENKGGIKYAGVQAIRLAYSCLANGYAVAGTVFVNAKNYLPLAYTQETQVPKMSGTFKLRYGTRFTITAPR